VKFSKTISIEESNLKNIKDIMSATGKTFAQVSRMLIGLGLQKYHANEEKRTTVTTTVIYPETEQAPPIEEIRGEENDE